MTATVGYKDYQGPRKNTLKRGKLSKKWKFFSRPGGWVQLEGV